jgi:hypothetical protein
MARLSFARTALLLGLVVVSVTPGTADDLPDCRGWPVYLSVTPAQPECDDIITLRATQVLTDSCWTAETPVFSDEPPDFGYRMATVDLWEGPPQGCLHMILEIPFTSQVGPLPPGPYSLSVVHTTTSQLRGNDACSDWIPFEVTCCPELPPEAASLRARIESAGTEIWLNWDDVAAAADYVVFGSDEPDSPFTRQLLTASNGFAGAGVPLATAPRFFLVAARNECGVGPRR